MSLRAFTFSLIGLELCAIESWWLVQGTFSILVLVAMALSIFFLFPLGVSMCLSWKLKTNTSQAILLFSSFFYLAWFIYAVNDMYVHPDPQAPIVLAVVGIYSLPVMLPSWIVASYFGRGSTC